MKLDKEALEAAIVAVESMGCVHFGAEIEAAIRAYLEVTSPPDAVGLIDEPIWTEFLRKLNYRVCQLEQVKQVKRDEALAKVEAGHAE